MVAADEENVHDNPAAEPLPEPAAVAEETPMETPHPDGDSPPMETPPRWRLRPPMETPPRWDPPDGDFLPRFTIGLRGALPVPLSQRAL